MRAKKSEIVFDKNKLGTTHSTKKTSCNIELYKNKDMYKW